jgi:hypothetical protein
VALCALGVVGALAPGGASAATITVSAGGDGSGCTLRNAISSADGDSNAGGCVATNLPYGNDTVQIPGSIPSPIQLGGQLSVTTASGNGLTVNGPGSGALDVRGGSGFRVMSLGGTGGTAKISNLTLSHGSVSGNFGGGIDDFSDGGLTLDHVVVSQNSASDAGAGFAITGGGGISHFGSGPLTVRDSTISDNTSTATASGGMTFNNAIVNGAGIELASDANVTIERSTLSGNTGTGTASGPSPSVNVYSGAISTNDGIGSVTIKDSTISGNQALAPSGGATHGGGIIANASRGALIQGSTITNNTAASGANVETAGGTTTFKSTIVSNPQVGTNCAVVAGANASGGYNLENTNTCGFNQLGIDHPNTATGLDPNLVNNGGPTMTHALLPGSAAIDQGFSFGEALDQRNLTRAADFTGVTDVSSGDGADIGAFERQPVVLTPIGDKTVAAGQALAFTTTATNPDPADTLSFGASNLPPGASFNTGTHTFTWTPSGSQVGTFPGVLFTLSDGYAPYDDSEAIAITVTAAPPPPPPPSGTTGGGGGTTTVPAGPTGLRAAALKRCKKKHGHARRKCKKRANLLPL